MLRGWITEKENLPSNISMGMVLFLRMLTLTAAG